MTTHRVAQSLHLEYKRGRIKQYFKEARALRTETTFNDTSDFGVGRGLSNFHSLQTLGQRTISRRLVTERLAHDCLLAAAQLADLVLSTQTPDHQPPALLKFGDLRVAALLGALCLFAGAPEGLCNGRLLPIVAQLLGVPDADYTARQMGYDLRGLLRKGLLQRIPGKLRSVLTSGGRRTALFLTKVPRPGASCAPARKPWTPASPRRRPCASHFSVDHATDALLKEAHLAA